MSDRFTIASWNVNSLRVRLGHVLDWLAESDTDVLALQETKVVDDDFPVDAFAEAGFDCIYAGQKTYNGVAMISRRSSTPAASDVLKDLPGAGDPERRLLVASFGDWRVVDVYVPNGQSVGSDKYRYKLDWLARLRDLLEMELAQHPKLVLLGDFNVAPDDRDVYDPEGWRGAILCSDAERAALSAIASLGLVDTFRELEEGEGHYSWWDYRAAAFRRNRGLRIDLILASATAADGLTGASIDAAPRSWQRPSDHAPTVAQFTV